MTYLPDAQIAEHLLTAQTPDKRIVSIPHTG